jgi:basic amino acid/polyamine antiporter, APA family
MSLFRKKKIADILAGSEAETHGSLSKHLGVRDLTAFGIAAIIGAGIFSTIGKASADGGPGVIFLFIFTALACACAAFAYAEFASILPVSGSAYTYSYVAFGELFAWIIGWALIMEYAIGNVTVAISWSDYFTTLMERLHLRIPEWMRMDYFSARNAYNAINSAVTGGSSLAEASTENPSMVEGYYAFLTAPLLGGMRLILDVPALFINIIITWLVYRGIKESRNAGNVMVVIKILVVITVIVVGVFYVDTNNWSPFMPNGIGGLLKGISAVFFAYIGFDAISTTAEECRDPKRDLPLGIINSIVICTILYVMIALVITGMVSYRELNVGDPLAYVFEKVKSLQWLSGIIAVSAVIAMASVMLVFQLGQPRIWMSMSRDGLLPPAFARIHPRFRTPSFSTVVTGLLVGIPIFFIDSATVTDICSAGTLFAFCLVCGGVIRLRMDPDAPAARFRAPYVSGRYIIPLCFLAMMVFLAMNDEMRRSYFTEMTWAKFGDNIPVYIFILSFGYFSILAWRHRFSLIPSLGLLSCFYMLSQLGVRNWMYFSGWLVAGLVIYFAYGRRHSKLTLKAI